MFHTSQNNTVERATIVVSSDVVLWVTPIRIHIWLTANDYGSAVLKTGVYRTVLLSLPNMASII